MFYGAAAFDQPIGAWNVSKVTNMGWMFASATTFNQNLSAWDVDSVTNMAYMFDFLEIDCPSWAVGKDAGGANCA